jgi:hypothetical protein
MKHKYDTLQHRYHFMKNEFERLKAEQAKELIDRIEEGAPAFLDSVSFHGQKNVNSVVRQKMDLLEKNIGRITKAASRFPRRGLVQQGV